MEYTLYTYILYILIYFDDVLVNTRASGAGQVLNKVYRIDFKSNIANITSNVSFQFQTMQTGASRVPRH